MPAHILIITNGALSRNPRPLKEAGTLARAGYEVTLLGIRNHAPSDAFDRELTTGAPYRHVVVDMLGGRGNDTEVWLRRAQGKVARLWARQPGLQSMTSLGPAGALLRHARQISADLTIVHNEVPHWVGTRLIAEGRRVAADIEDWHSEDLLPSQRRTRPQALLRANERLLLHHAAYTTTTSDALASALHECYGGNRPHVLSNAFPLQPDPSCVNPGAPPVFFWFSQTIGEGRGLELFMAAWKKTLVPSRVVFLGEVQPGYADNLLNRLPSGHRDRVTIRPLVSPTELPSLIARHDIGLALEQTYIRNRDLTITNKILQYLNAGLALVASDTSGQREVLARNPGAGLLVNLHESTMLASSLDGLLADHSALEKMKSASRTLAETNYCWEVEAPRLLELVKQALHP